MKWTSCNKPDCRHYLSATAEVEIRNKSPKVAMWLDFDQHEHVGQIGGGGQRWATYPCQFCKHYTPQQFDLYVKKGKEGEVKW